MEELIKKIASDIAIYTEMPASEIQWLITKIALDFNFTKEEEIVKLTRDLEEVSSDYPIQIDQLLVSLSKVSASDYITGIGAKRFARYTSIISSYTRESGEVVGNALKSILSRIDSRRSETISNIFKARIEKWSSFSNVEKEAIGIEMAGHYNLRKFLILMNGLSDEGVRE